MKHLKIFLFIMIIFLNVNVFATNTNVSNQIKYSTSSSKGTYQGDEIYLGGYNGQFTVGTRYNGRLSMVSFYLNTSDYNFTTNHSYTITLNMATEDWRNNFMGPQVINAQSNGTLGSSLSVSNFRFVSYKQVKFNFKTSGTLSPYLFFRLYSTDYASTNSVAITGTNNWNLSSIYINDNVSSTPTPAPVTPAPTPTPQPNNQDIINNANQNTQDIINNQNENNQNLIDNNNQNTTDIIDNANSNAQAIINNNILGIKQLIESNNVCKSYNRDNVYTDNSYLYSSGEVASSNLMGITDYIVLGQSSQILMDAITDDLISACFYDYSKNLISCIKLWELHNNDIITPPDTAYYYRSSIRKSYNRPIFKVCSSGNQAINNSINDLNDTMKNDNIENGVGSGFFNDFTDNSHGLTSIITSPLNAIQSLTSSTCTPLTLPIPFTNSNVSLPCMTQVYNERIPTIYNIWKVVSFGIIAYFICIDIFHIVKGFKDPESDKVEVVDL